MVMMMGGGRVHEKNKNNRHQQTNNNKKKIMSRLVLKSFILWAKYFNNPSPNLNLKYV
jgi:hypothetical protein